MKHASLVLILIAFTIGFADAQNKKNAPFKITYPSECRLVKGKDSTETFYISINPITNRAYMIYMDWLKNCYQDYPEQWRYAWPDFGTINGEIDYSDCRNFVELIKNANQLIREYMYNPKFIDYPVLGLQWWQANNFCKWLSDRYNESILMKKGFLSKYSYASNENCFTIESYLAGQYERIGDKEFIDKKTGAKGIKWEHHLLTPSFRLPCLSEMNEAMNTNTIFSELKAYPLPEFLKMWQNFKVKDGKIILPSSISEPAEEVVIFTTNAKTPEENLSEWYLDTYLDSKDNSLITIYSKLDQKILNYDEQSQMEKDSLGHMRYIIISEKEKKPFIVGYKPVLHVMSDELPGKYQIFRYAVSAVKED